MAFATTKHLNLRGYRESDKDYFMEQENDQRVMLTGYPGYVVPNGPNGWKDLQENFLSKELLVIVAEVKREYAGLRKWDEGEVRKEGEEKKPEDWDRELFAGYSALGIGMPKNRDAHFGIAINAQWWGNGFATEITEWMVQHAFEQLNVHRISLGYTGVNLAAKRVYEKCGFPHEGAKRKAFWLNGEWVDAVSMGILDEEYWERKKQLANKA
ncbi:acyl-CoA N-acyltransferase [Calocera viscosa TUFC12733]|uniref:Acyl-CoA N-acyltransferase n=1 Tax=Calocera viscosa (strain TUFC12733) TaxID=1330018 RepID=A0A167KGR5_CALVF|nr:acyl-CoA N-acyltransferase [Calocera viscosa TUFC12733]